MERREHGKMTGGRATRTTRRAMRPTQDNDMNTAVTGPGEATKHDAKGNIYDPEHPDTDQTPRTRD